MKKVFLFLAEGFEEMEAVAVVEILRRGGVEVCTVAIGDQVQVKSAHDVTIMADRIWNEVKTEEVDGLIFPGGMPGAQNLGGYKPLLSMMQKQYDAGRWVAAICAAPALVVGHLKPGRKLRLTCYPGFEKYFSTDFEVSADGVVVDGKVITGKGPGFAFEFGLTVLEHLCSAEKAKEVAQGMLL